MPFTYAKPGPPFNFTGNLSETQKEALAAWLDVHKKDCPDISKFHQIRAQQLRKTAGLLETFYQSHEPHGRKLAPTFQKDPWQPPADGHFLPTQRDDHGPSVAVSVIKDRLQYPMALDDEAVFRMNYVRTRIEFQEDLAQEAQDAPAEVEARMKDLDRFFADPHYRGVCVRDKTDLFKGEPRFRVHPLDHPTPHEKQTASGQLPTS